MIFHRVSLTARLLTGLISADMKTLLLFCLVVLLPAGKSSCEKSKAALFSELSFFTIFTFASTYFSCQILTWTGRELSDLKIRKNTKRGLQMLTNG